MTTSAPEPIVELLAQEWAQLAELGASLSPADWATPTECPGWSVQDQYAHIIGTESMLLGEPTPEPEVGDAAHIRNPIGKANEAWVASMRTLAGAEVLDRFRTVTAARLEQLRAFPAERFDEVGPTPVGNAPYREFMNVRLMDNWVHEQDIRRAVGRPGHLSGPIVEHSLGRFVPAMGFVVGKKAAAPDGASVVFDLAGEAGRTVVVTVADGKAKVGTDAPSSPTVTLAMDVATWWCLALGRWDGPTTRAEGLVTITGDLALGERVVDNLNFMI